jgi:hypothetical protein
MGKTVSFLNIYSSSQSFNVRRNTLVDERFDRGASDFVLTI